MATAATQGGAEDSEGAGGCIAEGRDEGEGQEDKAGKEAVAMHLCSFNGELDLGRGMIHWGMSRERGPKMAWMLVSLPRFPCYSGRRC